MLLLSLLACDEEEAPEEAPCTLLDDGVWTASGSAFGTGGDTLTVTLTMVADACHFSLDDWSGAVSDLPHGGKLFGADVTLDGDNAEWTSCTGTATGTTHLSGTCPDHGGDFALAR